MLPHFLTRRPEKHLIAALLALALVAGFVGFAQSPTHVVIMHTNDLHGQVLPRSGVGGLAEISTIMKANKPDVILDAGDMFTGTVITDEFKGIPIIEAMSRMGYHAAALGNHEFDYGLDVLRQRAKDAKFPIITANIDTRIPEIKKYAVVNVKGIRLGIIGLTTEEVRTTTHPKNLGSVAVRDIITSIRSVMREMRRRSDVVIVLSHISRSEEERIANTFPEIPLIISGHEHSVLGPVEIGKTTIAKTGSSGRNVGRVDLQFHGTGISKVDAKLIPVTEVAPDAEISKIIQPYETKVAAKMSVVIGEATGDLNRSTNSESALSNLVADAFRQKTKAQIVIQNIGGIRANIPKGTITWGRAFEVLPFQNTLVTLELTGGQLKQVLGRMLTAVSGVRVKLDLTKPAGQRLVSATLEDGSAIDDNKTYTVAINDFMLAGGDGFVEFAAGKNAKDTAIFLRDALVEYIQARRTIPAALDGRVQTN